MNTNNMFCGEIQILMAYACKLIYHQMPSLSASLDQIQKLSKRDIIYLFIEMCVL